jgi:hypothetical protein
MSGHGVLRKPGRGGEVSAILRTVPGGHQWLLVRINRLPRRGFLQSS